MNPAPPLQVYTIVRTQTPVPKEDARELAYVPAFDGLRALAVGAVLVSHMLSSTSVGWLSSIASKGWYGVDVFFVLSGFLITLVLTGELAAPNESTSRAFICGGRCVYNRRISPRSS